MTDTFEFEVCANGLQSALNASKAGATRVELCAGMPEGGTTPSCGTIFSAYANLKETNTKLHVLIRPRGGDFRYDGCDACCMFADFKLLYQYVDGFVFGGLKEDGSIDTDILKPFIASSAGKSMTFHRAFDMCSDPLKAIDQLAEMGFSRILTSGGCATAEEGIHHLREWQRHAEGKITLMAGGGINEHNIRRIYEETGITAFHFSAREQFPSRMTYRNERAFMGKAGADEFSIEYSTEEKVRRIISALQAGCN